MNAFKPGDRVWIRGFYVVWPTDGTFHVSSLDDSSTAIPDVPHLDRIARYLAKHPETVEALEEMIDDLMGFCHQKSVDTVSGLLRAMRGEAG